MPQSVSFYTLGCKLNFSETSTLARQLKEEGMQVKDFRDGADIYIINTCSVTDHADRKCRKVVKEALRYNQDAFVIVVGCYAQLKPQEIANIPGVDLVLGAAEKFELAKHITDTSKRQQASIYNKPIKETNTFVPAYSSDDRTRTFLKVQDGCDYFCSFCTIPLARGRSRSATIAQVIKEATEIGNKGAKEIVLTGVNIGDFGVQTGEQFADLVYQLDEVESVPRFRISSIEPNLLSNDIIKFVAESQRFMPHFHIPLQSGSDKLLKLMRRRYQKDLYKERVETIKQEMPHACIGVDVIVGFPGETEEDFLETYRFLNELDISYLHVFPYSERENTTAYKMPDVVPNRVRNERVDMLRILSEKKKRFFYEQHIQTTRTVLFEQEVKDGLMHGFTDNYIKVSTPYDPLLVNELVDCKLENVNEDMIVNSMQLTVCS
ncbi:MAG: tRNA (N(6)-L-threonylcarbamoyladenosine(37)-C(2))-methylthiotransferase MtaB [Bacteroidota bacterium]|nr:tRNA (N(6)-L-threonylcarbamoyladenosine(37)-C(2))-methylthiotransferase MtaB [Bacteroidota bacterium]